MAKRGKGPARSASPLKAPAPAKISRTQAERRRATQDKVLEATVDALLEVGYARLTATEVAARAGVSRGAQSHYFRGKVDLILKAARYEMDKATGAAHRIAEKARRSADPVDAFIEDMEAFFFARSYPAMIELVIAARTDPEIARDYMPIVEEYRTIINGIWLDVFKKAGIPDDKAHNFMHFTLYIMRGMALMGQMKAHREMRKPLLDAWRQAARTLLR
jgi:AcrR family transcriptional regulator